MTILLALATLDLVLSLVAFALYVWDKRAAKARRRRVPERTLHVVALLGGWPGAFLAQRLLRHKTAKWAFRRVFRWTVVLNVAGTAALVVRVARRM